MPWLQYDRNEYWIDINTNIINQVTRLNEIAINIIIHEWIIFMTMKYVRFTNSDF